VPLSGFARVFAIHQYFQESERDNQVLAFIQLNILIFLISVLNVQFFGNGSILFDSRRSFGLILRVRSLGLYFKFSAVYQLINLSLEYC
jgi:hypothetical protein